MEDDPYLEVKKLQNLVKELELQNKALRTGQTNQDSSPHQVKLDGYTGFGNEQELKNGLKTTILTTKSLEDVEDVDYSSFISSCQDDTWLYCPYESSCSPESDKRSLDTYFDGAFDKSNPIIGDAKREIRRQLTELEKSNQSFNTPFHGSHPITSKSTSSLISSAEDAQTSSPAHRNGTPNAVTPPQKIPEVNSGTFTRVKKPAPGTVTLSKPAPGTVTLSKGSMPMLGEGDPPQNSMSSMEGSYYGGETSAVSDIENMAKLQEANLRQHVTPANRKAIRAKQLVLDEESIPKCNLSRFDYGQDSQGDIESVLPPTTNILQRMPKNLSDSSLMRRPINSSDSSLERHSISSSNNSDDGSSTGRQLSYNPNKGSRLAPEAHRNGSAGGQRSMLPPTNYRSNNSQQQPRRTMAAPSGLARPQQRRGVSPANMGGPGSGIPAPQQSQLPHKLQRQIPKPGSIAARSSLPQFRRSNIPAPKSSATAASSEENWRDGCF